MGDKEEESAMPRDAKIVKSLLKSMGVEDYEPSSSAGISRLGCKIC